MESIGWFFSSFVKEEEKEGNKKKTARWEGGLLALLHPRKDLSGRLALARLCRITDLTLFVWLIRGMAEDGLYCPLSAMVQISEMLNYSAGFGVFG